MTFSDEQARERYHIEQQRLRYIRSVWDDEPLSMDIIATCDRALAAVEKETT